MNWKEKFKFAPVTPIEKMKWVKWQGEWKLVNKSIMKQLIECIPGIQFFDEIPLDEGGKPVDPTR